MKKAYFKSAPLVPYGDPTERQLRTFEQECAVLRAFLLGSSMRNITDFSNCNNERVRRTLKDAGGFAREYNEALRNIPIKNIQVDEFHVIVGGRDHKVSDYSRREFGWGAYWVWIAICSDTGFVIALHFGRRSKAHAIQFMQKLRARLPQDPNGRLLYKPTILSDGYPPYEDAIDITFGNEVNYGQYVKQYTYRGAPVLELDDESTELPPGSRFAGVVRRTVKGEIENPHFHTAYVEAVIGRYRKPLRCLNKKWSWRSLNEGRLQDALHIATFAFNYMLKLEVKVPKYDAQGNPKFTKAGNLATKTVGGRPPAIELELDHSSLNGARYHQKPNLWTLEGFVYAISAYRDRQKIIAAEQRRMDSLKKRLAVQEVPSEPAPEYAFYVSHKPSENRVVIHESGCDSARSAPANVGDLKRPTRWSGHHSLNEARAYANKLDIFEPDICRKCLGEYAPRGGMR